MSIVRSEIKNVIMKKESIYLLLFSIFIGASNAFCQQNLRLWYNKPAHGWLESVPLGNGRLGAMPDCGIMNENIVLNDVTLWSGSPQDGDKPDAYKALPAIRKLIFEGKNPAAQRLVTKEF
jgi:alpha-L-fucosidase 2